MAFKNLLVRCMFIAAFIYSAYADCVLETTGDQIELIGGCGFYRNCSIEITMSQFSHMKTIQSQNERVDDCCDECMRDANCIVFNYFRQGKTCLLYQMSDTFNTSAQVLVVASDGNSSGIFIQ
jgi:hypothetical protein